MRRARVGGRDSPAVDGVLGSWWRRRSDHSRVRVRLSACRTVCFAITTSVTVFGLRVELGVVVGVGPRLAGIQ